MTAVEIIWISPKSQTEILLSTLSQLNVRFHFHASNNTGPDFFI